MMGLPRGATPSVLGLIDPVEHSKRRRIWDRAFTPAAIKSYERLLQSRTQELMSRLEAREGQKIDIAEWFSFMALDFMGDFVFGGLFNFMEQGSDPAEFGKVGIKFVTVAEALGTIPWSNAIVQALPKVGFPLHIMAGEALRKRKQKSSGTKDLFYYLVSSLLRSFDVILTVADSWMKMAKLVKPGMPHWASQPSSRKLHLPLLPAPRQRPLH
jgi:hypothetical protein